MSSTNYVYLADAKWCPSLLDLVTIEVVGYTPTTLFGQSFASSCDSVDLGSRDVFTWISTHVEQARYDFHRMLNVFATDLSCNHPQYFASIRWQRATALRRGWLKHLQAPIDE